jgi:hypothetical protein
MSVPRFTDEMLVPLKQAMLARQPTFALTSADVETLVKETGLLKPQIQDWAKNFRKRSTPKKLDDVLANLQGNQLVRDSMSLSQGNVTVSIFGFASGPKSWAIFLIFPCFFRLDVSNPRDFSCPASKLPRTSR